MNLRVKRLGMISISEYDYIFPNPNQSNRLKIKEFKEKKKHICDYTYKECI